MCYTSPSPSKRKRRRLHDKRRQHGVDALYSEHERSRKSAVTSGSISWMVRMELEVNEIRYMLMVSKITTVYRK